jgi:hypothetical protein
MRNRIRRLRRGSHLIGGDSDRRRDVSVGLVTQPGLTVPCLRDVSAHFRATTPTSTSMGGATLSLRTPPAIHTVMDNGRSVTVDGSAADRLPHAGGVVDRSARHAGPQPISFSTENLGRTCRGQPRGVDRAKSAAASPRRSTCLLRESSGVEWLVSAVCRREHLRLCRR